MQILEIQIIKFIISIVTNYMAFCYLMTRLKSAFVDQPLVGKILSAFKVSILTVITFLSLKKILPDSTWKELQNPYTILNMFFGENIFEKDGKYVSVLIGIGLFVIVVVGIGEIIAPALIQNGSNTINKIKDWAMFKNKK